MNATEKWVMNSPIRAAFLRYYEAPLLLRLGGPLTGMEVLEIGCGSGMSTQLILKLFGAKRVVAVDLDPDLVNQARGRFSSDSVQRVEVRQSDITSLASPDNAFDAVVDFAALHHVPDWQAGVAEVHRVLKPGGRFLFEEVAKQWLDRWFARTFFLHPTQNRFNGKDFIDELERQGIGVGKNVVKRSGGDYIFGVGRKI